MRQRGTIIRAVDYSESDKIITILNRYGAKTLLIARRAKKVKMGLQAQTQLFVYSLFIYNQWRSMGTSDLVDIISQHYKLQTDLYVGSYATLAVETTECSMDEGGIASYNYQLLQFVPKKVESGTSAQLISVIVALKCVKWFGLVAPFNRRAVNGNDTQADLIGYSFKSDGAISRQEASKDVHAVILSNETLYLLDVLQELPIDEIDSLDTYQEIIDEMLGIILMSYHGYAGMFFKSQKLINQLKRLEQ